MRGNSAYLPWGNYRSTMGGMGFPWTYLLLFLSVSLASSVKAQQLCSFFSLPPAMKEVYGEAVVHQKPAQAGEAQSARIRGAGCYVPRRGIIPARHRAHITVRGDIGADDLAAILLNDFYSRVLSLRKRSWHERRLELAEFVPISEEAFIKLGSRRLIKGKSGVPWFDAWWAIRMGLPQTPDRSHHLVIICLKHDHDGKKYSFGHFCFALRKRGGDAQGDVVFDFRAPWYEDRTPTLIEGMNSGSKLEPITGHTANFYDWLYTQTSYRNCFVEMWFLPVSREQATVLRYFDEEIEPHDAKEFRGIRKNCASLGMAFVDRLGPISEPISLGMGLADIPTKTADRIVEERGGEFPFFQLENNTQESGREPTAKSQIHRAQPSREASRSFRKLRAAAGIN